MCVSVSIHECIIHLTCMHTPSSPPSTHLQESQIQRIFGTMINQKLQDFDEDVKPLGDLLTRATIEVYNFISTHMLPTPAKIHYLFNMRDISKVHTFIHTYMYMYVHCTYSVCTSQNICENISELQLHRSR